MGLQDTPSGERLHIGFFGYRNAGKSSLVNAVTGQDLSIVSDTEGTTTDPVSKAMELLPLGPVLIIDTPGLDDTGTLGEKRVARTRRVLNKTDIAVLVADAAAGLRPLDMEVLQLIQQKGLPYLIVYNKRDMLENVPPAGEHEMYVSALKKQGIYELKERLAVLKPEEEACPIVKDLLQPGNLVVLVVPVDSAAPKGRLILPQQQTIREILDAHASALVVQTTELAATLQRLAYKADLVITDSQAFAAVAKVTPSHIPLTSFSILMARHKGFLQAAIQGVRRIRTLQDGDCVLVSEGCTHHRQCEDIGTVKLPRWLREFTGKKLVIATSSGREFPEDLRPYALAIHCGGCMLNSRELQYRLKCACDQGLAMTNYGTAIAYMKGILPRSLSVFPPLKALAES